MRMGYLYHRSSATKKRKLAKKSFGGEKQKKERREKDLAEIAWLKKAYADSSVTINFLYLTTSPNDIAGQQVQERSWGVNVLQRRARNS